MYHARFMKKRLETTGMSVIMLSYDSVTMLGCVQCNKLTCMSWEPCIGKLVVTLHQDGKIHDSYVHVIPPSIH